MLAPCASHCSWPIGVQSPAPGDMWDVPCGWHLSSSIKSQQGAPEAHLPDEIISQREDPCR